MFAICAWLYSVRSSSPSMMLPDVTCPVPGSSWMIADAVVDLPDPDSPTMAMVSPGKMSNVTLCSTSRLPDCDSNATCRSRTLSSGSREVAFIGGPSLSGRGRRG